MLEVVQDFDLKDENLSWRRVQKLQLVKLLFIALTFGFSLAVTILVSEDKSFLSKLACSSYKPDFPLDFVKMTRNFILPLDLLP